MFELSGTGPRFTFQPGDARVWGATIPQLLRALATLRGYLRSGGVPAAYVEKPRFDTLGLMWDNSRNAVGKPATVKRFLRSIALMGMNQFMLYTEDPYDKR